MRSIEFEKFKFDRCFTTPRGGWAIYDRPIRQSDERHRGMKRRFPHSGRGIPSVEVHRAAVTVDVIDVECGKEYEYTLIYDEGFHRVAVFGFAVN